MSMEAKNMSLGIDIGSVSVKLVLLENGQIVDSAYRRFRGNPFETLKELLDEKFSQLTSQAVHVGGTGIGGKTNQRGIGIIHGQVGVFFHQIFGFLQALHIGRQNFNDGFQNEIYSCTLSYYRKI